MFSNFGSRLTSLRRVIAGEEVDDSEDENCSYISNVLRTYYTEKNRPYPTWLPPDPKGKIPTPTAAPQLVTSHSTPTFQGYGGGGNHTHPSASHATPSPISRPGGGGGGGLADLWGDSSRPTGQVPQVSSLRRGRSNGAPASGPATPSGIAQPGAASAPSEGGGYFDQSGSGSGNAYHSPGSQRGPSAQERLRARLHGR
ncbi:MFS sugar transporter [Ascosphaera apis ARSEF 7405]|uniref:MFS sugar transporter n=1 Tax=Ascosphaera apis ARSEF 7405 TaxID=392613 RepID=A0A167UZN0_9EURO|nr:MFS sugar transporter [Ascosphaera apis ARSEF 7405]